MSAGTIRMLADNLHAINGASSPGVMEGPAFAYRSGRRLYSLDSGSGPEPREAIRAVVRYHGSSVDEVVLLNSNGGPTSTGNNDSHR